MKLSKDNWYITHGLKTVTKIICILAKEIFMEAVD
jgi:hypothetical protein